SRATDTGDAHLERLRAARGRLRALGRLGRDGAVADDALPGASEQPVRAFHPGEGPPATKPDPGLTSRSTNPHTKQPERFRMIGTIVTFQYLGAFDAAKLHKIAEMARPRFERMPGLRSKLFTVNAQAQQAVNVYVWDSE